MLRRIHIRNHALITEVELNFDEGFHVFTGETGSGKSILLGALGLLLGKRADTASVGLSSDRAVVEGWFSAPHLEGWLLAQDLPATPRLTIRREVLKNGRSRVFVNDAQASVAQLKALGDQLVDIHQQHDLGISLEREALCHLLDQVGGHQDMVHTYQAAYRDWVDKAAAWKKLDNLSKAPQGDVPYLKHQRTELEALNLDALDWPELEASLKTLSRASELTSGLEGAAHALERDDASALGQLDRALKALRGVAGVDAEIDGALERAESARIELQDLADTLDDLGRQKQPDPSKLRMLEERHDALWSATKKHNVASPEDLLAKQHELDAQIQGLEGLADDLQEAEAAMAKAHRRHAGCGPGFAGSAPVRRCDGGGTRVALAWRFEDAPRQHGLGERRCACRRPRPRQPCHSILVQPRLALAAPDQGGQRRGTRKVCPGVEIGVGPGPIHPRGGPR